MDYAWLSKRVGIRIPEHEASIVLADDLDVNAEPSLRIRAMGYAKLGQSVMEACYCVYLYQQDDCRSDGSLGARLSSFHRYASRELYAKYSLGDCAASRTGRRDSESFEVSQRLMAAIYRSHGFLAAYSLLSDLYVTAPEDGGGHYRELLKEESTLRHTTPSYTYYSLDKSGLFRCHIRLGELEASGTGLGKKRAAKEAERLLVYRIREERLGQRGYGSAKVRVSSKKNGKLDELESKLGIPKGCLSTAQLLGMTKSVGPSTASNLQQEQEGARNVGAYVIKMLCFDNMGDRSGVSLSEQSKQAANLLNDASIAKGLPDGFNAFALGKNNDHASLVGGSDKAKADAARAILGWMWLNYCMTGDTRIEEGAQEWACKMLGEGSEDESEKQGPRVAESPMHEAARGYGLRYEEDGEILSGSSKAKPLYKVRVSLTDEKGWHVRAGGIGGSKRAARERAIRTLATPLKKRFQDSDVGRALLEANERADSPNEEEDVHELSAGEATRSLAAKIPAGSKKRGEKSRLQTTKHAEEEDELRQKGTSVRPTEVTAGHKRDAQQPKGTQAQAVSFDGPKNVLYVGKDAGACRRKGHHVEAATGILARLDGKPTRMNVNYCRECGVFFLGYKEYCHYRDVQGPLLGNLSFTNLPMRIDYKGGTLAEESVLMACGYSVSKESGLSPEERRLILANMLDRGIADKSLIIDYLQFFISNAHNRPNMQLACRKWSEDLDWVRGYRIDRQRHFVVAGIKRQR